jgi:predicted permease
MKLKTLFNRRRVEREMENELQFHLDREIEENMRAGMDAAAARRAALRATGSIALIKDDCRASLGVRVLDDLRQDLRYAVRCLSKRPGFTTVAVLTLAAGIGANTAIFSLLDAVMLKPLPVRSPAELVALYETGPEGAADPLGGTGRYLRFSYPRFLRLQQALGDDGSLAAVTRTSDFSFRQHDGAPINLRAQLVSGRFFSTLGIEPARGRLVSDADVAAASSVVILSDAFWRRRLAAADDVIGRTIVVNDASLEVIGVAPPGFVGLWTDAEADAWMPLTLQPALHYGNNSSTYDGNSQEVPWPTRDGIAWLNVFGRVASPQRAAAAARLEAANALGVTELAGVFRSEEARRPMLAHHLVVDSLERGFSGLRARYADALRILVIIVVLVLAATCVNIAGLLLVQGASSARETGIRVSLGASAGRLVRQHVTQSVLLALLGGAGGLLCGEWVSAALARTVLNSSALPLAFAPDRRVFVFTALVSVATAIAFGIGPALTVGRRGRRAAVAANQRVAIGGSAMKTLAPLVSVQIALSVVVVVAAVLLGRTLENFMQLDPGFDAEHLVSVTFDPVAVGYSPDGLPELGSRLMSAASAVPGVLAVSMSRCGLVAGCTSSSTITVGDGRAALNQNWIGPDYFTATGIRLLEGRQFDARDTPAAAPVAIITSTIARKYFPQRRAVGQHLGFGSLNTEIVGVAADARSITLHDPPVPMVYFPVGQKDAQAPLHSFSLDVRLAGDASAGAVRVRDAIRRADPRLSTAAATTLSQRIGRDVTRERIVAYLSGAFAGLAIFLASLGLYGVLSFSVARRTKEIGVRIALGARSTEVVRLVLGQSIALTAAGLVAGSAGAALTAQSMRGLLFGLPPSAPSAYVVSAATFGFVALLASYLPARRAVRVEPLEALRCE